MGPEIRDCRAGAGVTWCACSAEYFKKLSCVDTKDQTCNSS